MKTLIAIILTVIMVFPATAQTTFAFSGLVWGESLDAFDGKLTTNGFSGCAKIEKLKCKAMSVCSCSFTGGAIKNGVAWFDGNKLDQVVLNVIDRAGTTEVLKKKYGAPLPNRNVSHLSIFEQAEEGLTTRWNSVSGETLVIDSTGSVSYTSGAHNKQQINQQRNNISKF